MGDLGEERKVVSACGRGQVLAEEREGWPTQKGRGEGGASLGTGTVGGGTETLLVTTGAE